VRSLYYRIKRDGKIDINYTNSKTVKEAVVIYLKISWHSPGVAEEDHKRKNGFELETTRIRNEFYSPNGNVRLKCVISALEIAVRLLSVYPEMYACIISSSSLV
jgi:hypothetical protein